VETYDPNLSRVDICQWPRVWPGRVLGRSGGTVACTRCSHPLQLRQARWQRPGSVLIHDGTEESSHCRISRGSETGPEAGLPCHELVWSRTLR
jgi:hypothetical protein